MPRFCLMAAAVAALVAALARADNEKELLKTKATVALVTPDGKQVLAAGDNVRLIDYGAKKSAVFRKEYARPALSPDGKAAALITTTGGDKEQVELIDLTTMKGKGKFSVPGAGFLAAAVAPDGAFFARGGRDEFGLIDTKTGKEVAMAKKLGGQPYALAFRQDGKQVAAGLEKKVLLFDTDGLKAGHTVPVNDLAVALSYSPDGKQLAVGAGDRVSIVDVETGKVTATLPLTKKKSARDVSFAADGKVLATGCSDGTITLWDVAAKKPLDTVKMKADPFGGVSLSSDAKVLVVCVEGGECFVYDVSAATGK